MTVVRRLIMTGLRGNFRIRFSNARNTDGQFIGVCGARMVVNRQPDGAFYIFEVNADNWQLVCNIVTPGNMPSFSVWTDGTNQGTWQLEGYAPQEFRRYTKRDDEEMSAEDFANLDFGEPQQAAALGERGEEEK